MANEIAEKQSKETCENHRKAQQKECDKTHKTAERDRCEILQGMESIGKQIDGLKILLMESLRITRGVNHDG